MMRTLVLTLLLGLTFLFAPIGAAQESADPTETISESIASESTAAEAEAPASVDPAIEIEIELDSPRATMFTFLRGMNEIQRGGEATGQAWEAVEATIPEHLALNQESRRESALALYAALNKLGEVRVEQLPVAAGVAEDRLTRFSYFPELLGEPGVWAWVWEELKSFGRWPAGEIVLMRGPDGLWRFTPETIGTAPALLESLQPLPPKFVAAIDAVEDEGLTEWLGVTFVETEWWEWLALLGCIFVGLTVGKLVSVMLRKGGDRWEARAWPVRASIFHALAGPASLAILTLGLRVGLTLFVAMEEDVREFVGHVIEFLFLLAIGWALFNLVDVVDRAIQRVTSKTANRIDDMIVPLIRKTLRVFVVIIFTLFVAQNVFGLNITGWLAGLGIAGLAVSLAAQDSVKNIFGSLTVFFDKPFVVGEFISYGGVTGTVEEIGFRSTRIRTAAGHVVTVPNMKWIDNQVENIGRRPSIRREMNVTITYDTPPEKIEQAVQIVREVLNDPEVIDVGRFDLEKQPPKVAFSELNADSLNIKAFYWYQLCGDPDRGFFSWLEHSQIVNLKLFRRFSEAGIEFAFPTQTLYLAGDPERQLSVRLLGGDTNEATPRLV